MRPPIPSLVPETAPFTAEQRAWLNGFFAGLSLDGDGVTALSPQQSAGADARRRRSAAGDADDDDAPWHDQTMPLAERMKLAEGRPLRRRMMAAMAQQDCGQCGYNCEDYADALVRQERRAAEPLRAGRQGNRPHAQDAACGDRRRAGAAAPAADAATPRRRTAAARRRHARATIRSRRPSSRARGSTSRAPRRKPGTSSSISPACGLDYAGRRRLRALPAQRSGAGRRGARRRSTRRPDFPIGGRTLARGADRRRVAVARARHAVPAVLLHHRRRAAAEGARRWRPARTRTAMPRRSTCWRRSRNSPASGPTRKPSSRRSIRCSRGSIRSRRRRRCTPGRVSLTVDAVRYDDRQAQAARRRLDLPRRAASSPATSSSVYVQKAHAFGLPADPQRADHHDRPRHRRRAVPRLPARAHGDQGARAATGCSSATSARLRFLLRGRVRRHEGARAC